MGKFESSIGSRNFGNSPMKNFEVPNNDLQDFADKNAELERQFQEAREAKKQVSRLSEGAKKRIEMLVGMSTIYKTVEIDKNTYTIKSLKAKEIREATASAMKYEGTIEFLFEMRKQLLSRSLTEIAGIEITQFLGSDNFDDKLDFLDELDEALLNRLYEEHMLVDKEVKTKYGIKTEKDVKGVIEDLKK